MKHGVITVGMMSLLLGAQEAAPAAMPSPQTVRQKAALVQRLLDDSPLSKRIAANGGAEAKRLLGQATELSAQAEKALSVGNAAQAEKFLDEAMMQLNRAGRMAPDLSHRNHEQWARHGRLMSSIESLQASIRRHVEAEQPGSADDHGQTELDALLQRARALAAAEQVLEANVVLVQAEAVLLSAFKRSYRATTLDYSPRFRNAQEEFQFELARHGSYLQLVPLAVTELNPPLPAVQAIDAHMVRSRGGREQAERLAAERSFDAALKALRAATAELQQALAAAGLDVPKETKP